MRFRLLFLSLLLFAPCFAFSQWHDLGDVTSVASTPDGVLLSAGAARIQISVIAPNVVRLRYAPGDLPTTESLAVIQGAFPNSAKPAVSDSTDSVILDAGAIKVQVSKKPLRIAFLSPGGEVISQDQPGWPVSFNGSSFRVWKSMPQDEHYFALGDKTGPLDRRDESFTLWNMDMFGWQESTDPLYKAIPFFLAMRNGAAYGVFLDNTYRSNFDFGKELRDAYSFGSDAGALDYYFFYGPDPKRVVRDYITLTGHMPLPPLFTLGYQQSRYSYYPEARVREIASEMRKRKIPCDVLYLDIDYQDHNRPFTVDKQRFPHFEGMVQDLRKQGFKLVLITDLHIAHLPGYRPYDEGHAHDYFVHNPDGSEFVGAVWPGASVFPDFTREAVRTWWGTLYTDFVKTGVRGFWNDMNEPSVFETPTKTMPLDTVHMVESRKTDHREIHNVFGMENVRATYEGMLKLEPDLRPFVLTRAAYAGTQRYASTWTGDNTASWNHLRLSVPQLLNLGLSGFALAGADIGGFNGSPTPELLTRWTEVAAFNPFFRNHAAKGTRDREPWVDGPEHGAIRKRYIETRYRLVPYVYTGIEEASRTGVPLMRPLFLEFPKQTDLVANGEEYMFGRSLLVAPKPWPFLDPYEVTLPDGEWFDYWTGAKITGEPKFKVNPPLDTLPVYVRAGSIVPEQPVVDDLDQAPSGPLTLKVFPGPDCSGDLYTDDGNTLAYQKGQFLRLRFTCDAGPDGVRVHVAAEDGGYQPWFKELRVLIYGSDAARGATVDGKSVKVSKSGANAVALEDIPWTPAAHEIEVRTMRPAN
jgi:alpha-glucosidase